MLDALLSKAGNTVARLRLAARLRMRGRVPLENAPSVDGSHFLFLAGLHRSGTSIVHRLLREHPDTSGISGSPAPEDEGQHLQSVFPPALAFGGPGRFAFAPGSHRIESDELVSDQNRERLLCEWGAWFDLDRDVLIEKSPPNLLQTRFLQALFPGARFVVLVRHPIAVALATVKWSKTPVHSLLDHWLTAQQLFLDDLPRLEHCLVLRYEDLVADPAAGLGDICRLCGLRDFAPGESVQDHNLKYFDRWQDNIAEHEQKLNAVSPDLRDLAKRFGYSFEPPFVNDFDPRRLQP